MKKTQAFALAAFVAAGLLFPVSAKAAIVFSFEAAGVQQTTVAGAVTETFDSVPVGLIGSYYSTALGGTYTGGQVIPPDQYGGANGSRYDVVGLSGGSHQQTLTFDNTKTYFGMWWSAGDVGNELQFYNGATLLATFHVGDVIGSLNPAYYSNPNPPPGRNPNEPYVYLNFTGTGGTVFDSIIFNNPSNSGFETDNHSVYDQEITPPGTVVVPEPSTWMAGIGACALMIGSFVRKLRK